jgi:hypothetical protein
MLAALLVSSTTTAFFGTPILLEVSLNESLVIEPANYFLSDFPLSAPVSDPLKLRAVSQSSSEIYSTSGM